MAFYLDISDHVKVTSASICRLKRRTDISLRYFNTRTNTRLGNSVTRSPEPEFLCTREYMLPLDMKHFYLLSLWTTYSTFLTLPGTSGFTYAYLHLLSYPRIPVPLKNDEILALVFDMPIFFFSALTCCTMTVALSALRQGLVSSLWSGTRSWGCW